MTHWPNAIITAHFVPSSRFTEAIAATQGVYKRQNTSRDAAPTVVKPACRASVLPNNTVREDTTLSFAINPEINAVTVSYTHLYFNCLTVGSVMRPATDKHQISRAKLAYIIDSTAAPVCIIAPISSWAAAVTGFVEGEDGFSLFIQAIPYNFYALLTILMMIILAVTCFDYGPMAKHENNARETGDLFTTPGRPYANVEGTNYIGRGSVIDLVLPIACLIVCCVIGMIYTGGFFDGADFVTAFSNSDASRGLAMGCLLYTS